MDKKEKVVKPVRTDVLERLKKLEEKFKRPELKFQDPSPEARQKVRVVEP